MSGSNQKQFHAVSLSGGKDSTAMLLLMKHGAAKARNIPSSNGGSPKPRHYRFAMIVGMTSAAYMRFTTGHLVGAVLSRGSESCGSYANITQNCGQGCWNWTVEPERSLAPAPWGNSKRTGALIA